MLIVLCETYKELLCHFLLYHQFSKISPSLYLQLFGQVLLCFQLSNQQHVEKEAHFLL